MDFPNVGSFNKVENSLECAMLIALVNKFGPVTRWNGDKDAMKEIIAWSGSGGFCDYESACEIE